MEILEALRKLRSDFKADPTLSIVYQIAETLGWSRDQVREDMSMDEFWEWCVYLNGPFSMRTRESTLNGWLVHVIRSMMAPKGKKPKISDSMFPFHKMAEAYFAPTDEASVKKNCKAKPKIVGEHNRWLWRKKYEKAMADYNAGRITNTYGLYKGESMKRPPKKKKV